MRFAPRTVLGQLIVGSVLVQVVVFAAFMLVGVRREFRETRLRDRQRLMRQARTLADLVEEPLADSNLAMLDYAVRAVPISLTIGSVRITDGAGHTLRTSNTAMARTLNAREQKLLAQVGQKPAYVLDRAEDGSDQGVQPVVVNGSVRGVVWITPDLTAVRRLSLMDVENLGTYAAFSLLGNLLLVWWLSVSMARPLRQLRLAAQHVQANPNDLSVFPLPANVQNEAGDLQHSFNSMVEEMALQRRGTLETLSLLDSMLESAPVGFAFFDRQFRYVRLNQALARMNGVELELHLGRRHRDLLPAGAPADMADVTEELIANVFKQGNVITDHEVSGAIPGSGQARMWQTTLFPVSMANDELRWVGIIVTDVTERKRAEEAMRRSERLASAGRLAATIAHEINNPLESVTNLLYLLRTDPSLNEEAQEYVGMAQSELSRVAEITGQTLKFSRRSTLPVDVRLPEVLRSVLTLHQGRMQSPLIESRVDLSEGAISFGYAGELRQVFANLIGNAIDSMPEGGTLYVRARAAQRLGRRGTRVTVADTGVGMTDAVRVRIFEPFFTTKEATGTGIGLWVSAEILHKHHAILLVRSRVRRWKGDRSGTVFSIFFPQDGVPRGPIMVPTRARATSGVRS